MPFPSLFQVSTPVHLRLREKHVVAMTTEHLNKKRERGLGSEEEKECVEEEVGRADEGRGRWEEGSCGGHAPPPSWTRRGRVVPGRSPQIGVRPFLLTPVSPALGTWEPRRGSLHPRIA